MADRKNPYEDADPIPIVSSSPHRQKPSTQPRTRSRSVQSARDSARSQQRPSRTSENVTRRNGQSTSRTNNRRRSPSRQPDRVYSMRTRRKTSFGIIAGIIIVAIVILSALLWWINRPVPITVNGEAAEIRVGSQLEDVVREQEIVVEPGDYVSVTDHVLEADQGYAFTATVNGKTLSPDEVQDYRVVGEESIEFTDGQNRTEEYTAESEVLMPYLRMEGTGYALQYVSQWGYAGELEHRVGKVSKESADVVVKEAQDCVVTCLNPYIEGDRKIVALTFDDGPADPYTEQYLEILDRYGVKATFFNLGENTESYPEIAKKVVAAGHQLCNHTMAHNQLTAVDGQTIYDEITRSADAIEQATGVHTTHIRPPYGDFTERSWLGSGGSITASIRWTGDSQDWSMPGVDTIVSNSLLNLYSGTIILMHDGGGDRTQDVEALPKLIEELQAQGYEFVTVSDLMRAMGTIPEDICSGTASMPEDAVWPEEIHPDDLAAAEAASSS